MSRGAATPPSEAPSLLALAIRRPVAVTMLALGVVVFGAVAYGRLQLALMPRFSHPTLTVRTAFPGSAPEEVEQFVTIPLEKQLSILSGLSALRSRSRAGTSEVLLEFEWGTDLALAALEVREKMDRLFLPDEVEPSQLLRFDPDDEPIMRLALLGTASLAELRRVAEDELKPRLLALTGVASVSVRGGAPLEVVVELDEGQLARHGWSVAQVARRLEAEHVNLAGGVLDEGRIQYRVRTLNELGDLDEIGQVALSPAGAPVVRLGDLARVLIQPGRTEVITRANGLAAVEVEVFREADRNVVEVARRVRDFLRAEAPAPPTETRSRRGRPRSNTPAVPPRSWRELLPGGVEARIIYDQSRFIEAALGEVRRTALLGGVLAVAVLFVFLGSLRATALVVAAIPLSILATFLPMFLSGTTLNLISLGGLALGIGMLVDNSIVVLEAIHRLREQGLAPAHAALQGVREVGGAVTASTLTTIAVFLPMAFVEGVAGEIIGDLALTVVFSLLASLLVAVLVLPSLTVALEPVERHSLGGDSAARGPGTSLGEWAAVSARRWLAEWRGLASGPLWLVSLAFPYRAARLVLLGLALAAALAGRLLAVVKNAGASALGRGIVPPGRVVAAALASFRRGVLRTGAAYRRFLDSVLRRPALILGLAGLVLLVTLRWGQELPQGLLPPLHQGVLGVRMELPAGTSLAESATRLGGVERRILALPGVARTFLRLGEAADDPVREQGGEHVGTLWVELAPVRRMRLAEAGMTETLRAHLAAEPDLRYRIEPPPLFTLKPPLAVEIQGQQLDRLARFAAEAERKLRGLPQLREVKSLQQAGKPELQIVFDREMLSRHGLSARDVAERVRDKLQGETPVRFRTLDKQLDVRVRVSRPQLDSVAELSGLVVNPGQPVPLPLSAVAELRQGVGPSEIRRSGQHRTALVTAGLGSGDLRAARDAMRRVLADLDPPSGVSWHLAGQGGEMRRSLRSLAFALALAVFLVYLVMASQFESLLEPLVILCSVPLAGIGVVAALWASGGGWNVLTGLGLIVLVGIVVNNAIVLTNTFNRLHREGLAVTEALLEAGVIRLRPILMTTLTTLLGLLPLAAGQGAGAEIRQPIALTLIAGLLVSMVLTLAVVPCAYRLLARD